MKKDFVPTALDIRAFARAEGKLSGTAPLAAFSRLVEDVPEGAVAHAQPVDWRAAGEMRAEQGGTEQVWLSLQASGRLPLVCQRCLQPVEQVVEVDREFRFVADEQTAALEDDDSEEDVLVMSRAFDLLALLEDELLMALPLVPRHEVCPAGGVQVPVAEAADEPVFEEKPNPFAVLQGFKTNKSK